MKSADGDGAIREDAQDGTDSNTAVDLNSFEAAEASFLERITKAAAKPADEATKDKTPKAAETADDGDDDEDDVAADKAKAKAEDTDEDDDDAEKPVAKRKAADDEEVDIKVGEETHTVSVSALKRLFGQEASLTKKSQEVSTRRKEADEAYTIASESYGKLLTDAKAKADEYGKLDFERLAQTLTPVQFNKMRSDRDAANSHFNFLAQEAKGFVEKADTHRKAMNTQLAHEAVAILQDPDRGIPGWNVDLYKQVRTYAIDNGLEAGDFDQLVSAPAIKMIHSAMSATQRLAKAEARLATLKEKIAKAPKNAVPSGAEDAADPADVGRSALARLAKSGSSDDAEDVFLARIEARRQA